MRQEIRSSLKDISRNKLRNDELLKTLSNCDHIITFHKNHIREVTLNNVVISNTIEVLENQLAVTREALNMSLNDVVRLTNERSI